MGILEMALAGKIEVRVSPSRRHHHVLFVGKHETTLLAVREDKREAVEVANRLEKYQRKVTA